MAVLSFRVVLRSGRATAALQGEHRRELLENHGFPSAKRGRAFLLVPANVGLLGWGAGGADAADDKLAVGGLNQFHVDVGDVSDKDVAHFDDLDIEFDKL